MTNQEALQTARPEIVRTRTVHDGWTRLLIATIRLADGREIRREIEDHGEAACVLPYNPLRKTAVLVRQLRAPVLFAGGPQETLEAIAGIIEDEDAAGCARREALEEAQLPLDSIEHIATAWTMPGVSTERMHLHLATYSAELGAETSAGIAAEHEDTIPIEIGLADLPRMADSGELTDLKTLLLVQTLRLRKPDLF